MVTSGNYSSFQDTATFQAADRARARVVQVRSSSRPTSRSDRFDHCLTSSPPGPILGPVQAEQVVNKPDARQ